MKKKIFIIGSSIFSFFVLCFVALLIFYNVSLGATGSKKEEITFVVESGSTSKEIIDLLYQKKLIKNKYVGYVYLKLNNDIVLQAGDYNLNAGMGLETILDTISSGNVIDNSISVTFIEGKRITNYAKIISEKFGYASDEVIKILEDKKYLNELIDKYWFLTEDILNDKLYYALEGYLFPNTYNFEEDASVKDIIEKMLDTTGSKLDKYKDLIKDSEFTVHEILTMASIIELEGANSDDRFGVAGVFYNRLNNGWSLGSDVTTYYAARVEMNERDLYFSEINDVNDYNTRTAAMAGKLPVGPISNPSINSIEAALKPKKHDYFFFVADRNKKTYFTKTQSEHTKIINKLKSEGLWYVYS